jgi:molybdate transport system substrate-binding protein
MSHTTEIQVMSSAAFKAAYLELVPEFERATGHKVATRWIPGVDLLKRVKDGEASDLVILQAGDIDELIKAGRIKAGSRVDLAKSGVGIAVRAGAPKPDITSTEALKRALLAAKCVAYSTGPSGVYVIKLFERLGIADEVKAKSRQVKGEPVGAVVARGEAEIGFQQVSELLPVPGIDFLGPLPADIQQITIFSAGMQASAKEPDAAQALIKFITAPAAASVIRKTGMEPA